MQWFLFVYSLLPIGLTSLILVSLPVPSKMGKYLNSKMILWGSSRIPYMKINVIQFLIGISILTFALTTYTVYHHSQTQELNWNGTGLNPTCIRWRAERNFWICTTNILLYWATYIIYNIKNILYQDILLKEENPHNMQSFSIQKKDSILATKTLDFVSNEETGDSEAKKND